MEQDANETDFLWLQPSLAPRTLRVVSGTRTMGRLLFVQSGRARLDDGSGAEAWTGPCLVMLPGGENLPLFIEAGSSISLISLGPTMPDEQAQERSDLLLALLAGDGRAAAVERRDMARLSPLLAGLARERDGDSGDARQAAGCYLKLVLLEACRLMLQDHDTAATEAGSASLLHRFRQLVERNFRRQRPMTAYADDLGVTADRLHDICRRTTGRPPLQLVHERLTREAMLHLERSARTIQQIAEQLGFRDPTYFSHFFKRQTGLSPAAYRRRVRTAGEEQRAAGAASYADWP